MEQRIYANFDLLLEEGTSQSYRARVLGSPAGEAAGAFVVPFTRPQLAEIERRLRGGRKRKPESGGRHAARQFGDALFRALFTEDIARCYRASLAEVERRGEGLRLRMRLADVPELIRLPWELLYDARSDSFLALSVWTPVVRYLELPLPVKPVGAAPPLKILVMISQPPSVHHLQVEEEWSRLQEAVAEIRSEGLVSVTRLPDATLLSLQRALRDEDYHMFHFVGHGSYDEVNEDGLLVLEDGEGAERAVSGRDLGAFLRDQRSLGLVVLNSCSGAAGSSVDPFTGSAQSLILAGIPAVVAMQGAISDAAALQLTSEFYSAIAHGHGVDTALGEARRAIFGLGDSTEWATPVLYMRSPDGAIFDMSDVVRSTEPPVQGTQPKQTRPTGGSHRRRADGNQASKRVRPRPDTG